MKKDIIQFYQSPEVRDLIRTTAESATNFEKCFIYSELKLIAMRTIERFFHFDKRVLMALLKFKFNQRLKHVNVTDKLFKQFQHLPKQYAAKLGSHERIGWERADVVQELNIKMLMTIRAWGRRYLEFMETGRYEPIKLELFIRTAMNNRLKDFYKLVERHPTVYSPEIAGFDVIDNRPLNGSTIIDLKSKQLIVSGEDLLEGLDRLSKAVFLLNFVGFKPHELDKTVPQIHGLKPSQIIKAHQARLSSNPQVRQLLAQKLEEVVF